MLRGRHYLECDLCFIDISYHYFFLFAGDLVSSSRSTKQKSQGMWSYITGKTKVEIENVTVALPVGKREYTAV